MSSNLAAICVVGVGRAGMVHARNMRWNVPRARLVAIVEPDAGRAREAAAELELDGGLVFDSLSEALAGSVADAVVITTPTFTHADLVVQAAEAGRHVLCEKPMTLSLEECDRMEEAVTRAGVIFEMGFMRRFDPAFVQAERLIREGRIGSPVMMRSLTRGPGLPPPWACDPRTSNGMLAEVNSHDFDSVPWLMGAEARTVFARAAALKVPELSERYPGFYDSAMVMLELATGGLAVIEGLCPAGYGYDARAEVVGSEGAITIGGLEGVAVTTVRADDGLVRPAFPSWRDRFRDAYLDEDAHFVRRILGRADEVAGLQAGRRALEMVLAANRSIVTGTSIRLPH